MADFIINRTVYLHGRTFKKGQEEALAKAGLEDAQRTELVRRGTLASTKPARARKARTASKAAPKTKAPTAPGTDATGAAKGAASE